MAERCFDRSLPGCLACLALLSALAACNIPSGTPLEAGSRQPGSAGPATPPAEATPAPIPMQVGFGARGSFYELYFTDPFNPNADNADGGPDGPLVQAIDQARISLDVAAYSLDLFSIQNALLRAEQRGIPVRMVMETSNLEASVPQTLVQAGIPIVGDAHGGLMHDKFVVIDRSEVWTGSMNFTDSGVYADNNNLVRIRSDKVAQDYTVEFEEMFKNHLFGADLVASTPYSRVVIDGIPVEVYFSPDDHVATRIIQLLRAATQSIYFMAYSFTASDFSQVLIQKARQGVSVAGVMETSQVKANQGSSVFVPLLEAGVPVYLDGNPGQMHHKVFIIDGQIVITGSYNFSQSAETSNDEDVVIFFSPQIAAQYMGEYQRVYAERSLQPFSTETPTPTPSPTPTPTPYYESGFSSGASSSGLFSSSGSSDSAGSGFDSGSSSSGG